MSSPSRKITAVVRWGISAWVLAAIVTQIWSEVANDAFYPEHYFSYFTIQSSLINIVAFAAGGVLAWRTARDTKLFTLVRMSVFSYAIVTGVVYNVLLRNIPSDGYEPPAWCNESTHVWVPIVIVLEWLCATGRISLRLRAMWWVLLYPLGWVAFTVIRGILTGWWPYPFLQPDGPNGVGGVVAYIVGIAAFMSLNACIALLIAKLWTKWKNLAPSSEAD
ncbi:hypothetical protein M2119_000463 [Aurantimicrobium minutum]|uniref:Pr6Pr family membrane protein n=1 Tax=Aurantimicrobium minutum TaxID=708131 RepID=UPI00247355C7|nr:Pr6Pr family membrane protein [Aurantimicrobium minutum]MDH6532226.1 hypothetical protein [Aurantimicrobium minutum]